MRLFIAINFDAEAKSKIRDTQNKLKATLKSGNFTREENLHLTLVFLGEVHDSKVDAIKEIMDNISMQEFYITINGLGRFSNHSDIIWLGINECWQLKKVYEYLCNNLLQKGFAIEKRPFQPHLTLVRKAKIISCMENVNPQKLIANVSKISLMQSERIGDKLTYTEIYEKHLVL